MKIVYKMISNILVIEMVILIINVLIFERFIRLIKLDKRILQIRFTRITI